MFYFITLTATLILSFGVPVDAFLECLNHEGQYQRSMCCGRSLPAGCDDGKYIVLSTVYYGRASASCSSQTCEDMDMSCSGIRHCPDEHHKPPPYLLCNRRNRCMLSELDLSGMCGNSNMPRLTRIRFDCVEGGIKLDGLDRSIKSYNHQVSQALHITAATPASAGFHSLPFERSCSFTGLRASPIIYHAIASNGFRITLSTNNELEAVSYTIPLANTRIRGNPSKFTIKIQHDLKGSGGFWIAIQGGDHNISMVCTDKSLSQDYFTGGLSPPLQTPQSTPTTQSTTQPLSLPPQTTWTTQSRATTSTSSSHSTSGGSVPDNAVVDDPEEDEPGPNVLAIALGVCAGVAITALIILAIILGRRKCRKSDSGSSANPDAPETQPNIYDVYDEPWTDTTKSNGTYADINGIDTDPVHISGKNITAQLGKDNTETKVDLNALYTAPNKVKNDLRISDSKSRETSPLGSIAVQDRISQLNEIPPPLPPNPPHNRKSPGRMSYATPPVSELPTTEIPEVGPKGNVNSVYMDME